MVADIIVRVEKLRWFGRIFTLTLLLGLLGITTQTVKADSLTFNPDWGSTMYPHEYWSTTLTASGGTLPYTYAIVAGNLPEVGLTDGSPSATFAGTPLNPGSYTMTFRVTDSSTPPQIAYATHTYEVYGGLWLSDRWGVTLYPGEAWSLTLTASGGSPPYSYRIDSGSVPGLSLTDGSPSAIYAGTPTTPGSYPVIIRVTDSAASPATMTISNTLVVPQLLGLSNTSGNVLYIGEDASLIWDAVGGIGDYHFNLVSGSIPGLSFSTGTTSATLSGTPTQTGSYPIRMQVEDSASPTPHVFTMDTTFIVKAHTDLSLQLITANAGGDYRVGENIWAIVQLNQSEGVLLPVSPPLTVGITSGSGPSCTATLDEEGYGECALNFSSTGNTTVTASFAGSTYFDASSDSETIQLLAANRTNTLSAGRNHTCMLDLTGKINCWGDDDFYSIKDGEGNLISDITSGSTLYTQVSAGGYHTCALDQDGRLHCWGDSASIVNPASIPNVVNGKTLHYIQVSAGDDYVCAVDTRHKLHCWGEIPGAVLSGMPESNIRTVSAGNVHACVIAASNNGVTCWGLNSSGQTNVPSNLQAKKIAVGNTHTCAIRSSDQHAICWGTPSINLPANTAYQDITSGANYSCGLATNDAIDCGGTSSVASAAPVGSFEALAAGLFHGCALRIETGEPSLQCWGDNTFGQAPRLSLIPASVSPFLPVFQPWSQDFTPSGGIEPYILTVSAGLPDGLALAGTLLSGTPQVNGTFTYRITLNETFVSGSSPYPLQLSATTQSYTQTVKNPATTISFGAVDNHIAMGSPVNVNVIVTKTGGSSAPVIGGTVTIIGREALSGRTSSCSAVVTESGGLGLASCPVYFGEAGSAQEISAVYNGDTFYTPSSNTATQLVTITPIVIQPAISMGQNFGCSINNQGQPACWGLNDSGQTQPVNYVFRKISAGNAHVCALGVNSQIFCWGWNGYGLVQNRSLSFGYVDLTSGDTHSCGLNWNGRIVCWGDNSYNQSTPSMGYYTSLDAGSYHSCAITSSGAIACWGLNDLGQSTPPGGAPYHSVSAGGKASCALNASNGIVCWGGTAQFRAAVPAGSFLSVSVGQAHACALDGSNQLHCWGDSPATIPGNFGSVSAANGFNCALTTADSFLKCWGNNEFGQAPVITIEPEALPVLSVNVPWSGVFSGSGARSSNLIYSHSGTLPPGLSLTSNGLLFGTATLGNDYNFTIRVVESDRSPALMQEMSFQQRVKGDSVARVDTIEPANPQTGQLVTLRVHVFAADNNQFTEPASGEVQIAIDGSQVCKATLSAGWAECTHFFTTAGDKSLIVSYTGDEHFLPSDSRDSPFIAAVEDFQQVARLGSGAQATYIHHEDGSLSCLGADCQPGIFNQLYTQFGIGNNLACALQLDGSLICRQDGIVDQLEGQFIDLAVGYDHFCALDASGQLSCWGGNDSGQSLAPSGEYLRVYTGRGGSCAMRSSDQQIVCWGNLAAYSPPALIFNPESITIGNGFACGLSGEEISCWGEDVPARLSAPGAAIFRSVTAGDQHGCALDDEGLIQCWGNDDTGQLQAPYGAYSALDAFGDHTCAIRTSDEITCWGDNPDAAAPQISVTPFSSGETVVYDYWEHFFNPGGGARPYTARVVAGSLPVGITLEDDVVISPAGVVAYGAPSNPALYQFVIRWEDSSTPRLIRDVPYQLMVTGADLQVEIRPDHATTALKSNRFSFDYVLTNHTPLDIPGVQVEIALPDSDSGWEDLSLSGLDDCLISAEAIQCGMAVFPASSSMTLRVSGTVNGDVDSVLATSAQIQPVLTNWPEIKPSDNADSAAVVIAYTSIALVDDFSPNPAGGWISGTRVTAPSGEDYLQTAFPGLQELRLLIDSLAPHRRIKIRFDLFIIGDWQGNGVDGSLPALFSFGQTGETALVNTTFCNLPECTQSYPARYPDGDFSAFRSALGLNDLGYSIPQARYQFNMVFDHDDPELDLTWLAENLPEDARFGIDHVEILLDSGWRWIHLPLLIR